MFSTFLPSHKHSLQSVFLHLPPDNLRSYFFIKYIHLQYQRGKKESTHFVICYVDWAEPRCLNLKLELEFPIVSAKITQGYDGSGVWKNALQTGSALCEHFLLSVLLKPAPLCTGRLSAR